MAHDGTGMFRRAVQIPVDVKLDGDVYVATSPLVKALIVVSKSHQKLMEEVDVAMRRLTDHNLKEWESRVETNKDAE